MELVCPYCSAEVAGPPPDGACPVCGESLAGIEPSVPEAPLPPGPVSSSVGVVPLGAEDAAPTRTTGIATGVQEPVFEPPVELARELEPSIVEPSSGFEPSGFEPSVVEDTVVSGMQLLAPEPTSEPSWEQADVEGQAKAAFGGWTAPAKAMAVSAPPATNTSLPGLTEFLALVLNEAPADASSSGARERECPRCRTRVFASADELCPNCGDLLDGEPTAVVNGHAASTSVGDLRDAPPGSAPEPVEAAVDATPAGTALEAMSSSAGATPEVEPASQAGLRECAHCHNRVFASQDELCPECGDSLESAPLVEDSQTAAGPIEERDCVHCGTRVVGTPTSPCPACGKVLGAAPEPAIAIPGLRAAPTSPSQSADDRAFETTFVGPGAAEPFAAASGQGTQLCPFCLEEIPGEATACPACGKALRGAEAEAKGLDPDDEKTVAELPPPPIVAPVPAPVAAPAPVPVPVPAAPAPVPAAAAPTRPRAPTLRPDVSRPVAAPSPAAAPAPLAAAPMAPVSPALAEPANEPTVADPTDAGEATVPDPMASEEELVLGEDPGTEAREERFPSPKIQRSREQVSLPGRKAKPATPVSAPVAAAAAAPTNPAAAAPTKAPTPPWQGSPEPVKIMPVRAVAAPPNIGTARGTAAEPPPPRRGGGLFLGIAVVGLVAASAGGVFVFGMGGKFPGGEKGDGAVATPRPVETTPAIATATPVASTTPLAAESETPIATASTTPVVTETPEIVTAPTPVPRMSELAVSTPVATTPPVRPTSTPVPTSTRAVAVATPLAPTPTPVIVRTPVAPTPTPAVSRTPVVMTPPPATPTPVVVVATPTPPPATPPPATPPPATPAATQVASVDPRAAALTAAVKQVKSADPDTISSGVKALKRLVKDDASYADAWFWLGFGSGRIEENNAACDAFRKYLKLAPAGAYAPTATATVRVCDQ